MNVFRLCRVHPVEGEWKNSFRTRATKVAKTPSEGHEGHVSKFREELLRQQILNAPRWLHDMAEIIWSYLSHTCRRPGAWPLI